MRERAGRVASILVADARERLRRGSTLILFLAICFVAYVWVPDPSTGRALLVVDGRRALYNSHAIALATAMLGAFLLGLFGYYMVSRGIGRDLHRRIGSIVAASPVRSWEYLVGKGLGSFLFLGLLAAGYMLSSMVVQIVRSEEPLHLAPYLGHYLFLVPPSLLFTSAVALLFESMPRLAGKLGDVLYFFVWMVMVGASTALAIQAPQGGLSAAYALDVTGMATAVRELQAATGTQSFAVGASAFDPARGVYAFEGLSFGSHWLLARGLALLVPVPLFLLAWWRFHRFDPARVRTAGGEGGRGYLHSLRTFLRPLASWVARPLLGGAGRPGVAGAAIADGALVLIENPIGLPAAVLSIAASVVLPLDRVASAALPLICVAMAVLVASGAAREAGAGTGAQVYAAPRLAARFVGWKLASALLLCLLLVGPAAVRFALVDPQRGLSILTGAFFVAAAATAAGVLTGSSKAFLVLFLSFWYVVLNDGGASPGLDFAGFYGTATAATAAAYSVLALALLGLAQVVHRVRRRS